MLRCKAEQQQHSSDNSLHDCLRIIDPCIRAFHLLGRTNVFHMFCKLHLVPCKMVPSAAFASKRHWGFVPNAWVVSVSWWEMLSYKHDLWLCRVESRDFGLIVKCDWDTIIYLTREKTGALVKVNLHDPDQKKKNNTFNQVSLQQKNAGFICKFCMG